MILRWKLNSRWSPRLSMNKFYCTVKGSRSGCLTVSMLHRKGDNETWLLQLNTTHTQLVSGVGMHWPESAWFSFHPMLSYVSSSNCKRVILSDLHLMTGWWASGAVIPQWTYRYHMNYQHIIVNTLRLHDMDKNGSGLTSLNVCYCALLNHTSAHMLYICRAGLGVTQADPVTPSH